MLDILVRHLAEIGIFVINLLVLVEIRGLYEVGHPGRIMWRVVDLRMASFWKLCQSSELGWIAVTSNPQT